MIIASSARSPQESHGRNGTLRYTGEEVGVGVKDGLERWCPEAARGDERLPQLPAPVSPRGPVSHRLILALLRYCVDSTLVEPIAERNPLRLGY